VLVAGISRVRPGEATIEVNVSDIIMYLVRPVT
jgi:hypothetical protein